MEYKGHDFLEELLSLRIDDPWESATNNIPKVVNDFYTNVDTFLENPFPQNYCFDEFPKFPFDRQTFNCSPEFYTPFGDEALSAPEVTDSSIYKLDTPQIFQKDCSFMSIIGDLEVEAAATCCKMETIQSPEIPIFNMGIWSEKKSTRVKKLNGQGQPSKNLMAERRRRKRLNERLSMLRSVVPKISKMDRTSILGDTIDYMKELLERINNLQEEIEVKPNDLQQLISLKSIFKDVKPNEGGLLRNSPKFDVERRNMDTRIEICCAGKPGLLLSTVTTLEALGLDIQQCVISCFNDFGMQASCSEEMEQRGIISSADIKQALFRNAGYGGRCL